MAVEMASVTFDLVCWQCAEARVSASVSEDEDVYVGGEEGWRYQSWTWSEPCAPCWHLALVATSFVTFEVVADCQSRTSQLDF